MSGRLGDAARRASILLGLAFALVSAGPLAGAAAATWTVNTTNDAAASGSECMGAPNDCSLRQAIDKADTDPAGDTVELPAGEYDLIQGPITVTQAITITGAAANTTTISGSGNGDAGIFLLEGDVTISHVTITGGSTTGDGGAIDIADGSVTLGDDTLSDDTAASGGAIELTSDGSLTISDSTLGPGDVANGGLGGAVDNNGSAGDGLSINDSTISGDSATNGGWGGGISTEAGGRTALSYDTIDGNSASGTDAVGGDLYADNGGDPPVDIADSIVADGNAPSGPDCNYEGGTDDFQSEGHNLTDDTVAPGVDACGFESGDNDLLGDPDLGALANNGGPTDTMLPASGSPEVGAIPSSDPNCTGTDQRGVSRPLGAGCTIGAVEGSGSAPPPSSASLVITASSSPTSVGPDQPVVDTFTITNNGPNAAVGVLLNDPLPAGVTLVGATTSQGSCSGTTTVTCNIGSVTVGIPQTVLVTIAPTSAGTVSNTATVIETTANPNLANNSATATTTVTSTCTTSMTIDAVQVFATCIAEQSDGTYLATGDTSFGDGARIVDGGTATPATLVLDPGTHEITIAPAGGGGAQSGELEAGGVDIATGDLVIHTQGETDPISGVAGSASVTGISSIDLTLSEWSFDDSGVVVPTVYLAPSSAGGGAIVDGQLKLPSWLGDASSSARSSPPASSRASRAWPAVQANSSGAVSVVNGGISFNATVLGDSNLQLANAEALVSASRRERSGPVAGPSASPASSS